MSDALLPTSILTLGAEGVLDGTSFRLVGRRCLRGYRGNLWNEWTLSDVPYFLSESAGSFTLHREAPLVSEADVLLVGAPLPWLVVERGKATVLAEWGAVEPCPATYDFVDLSSIEVAPRRASIALGQTFIGRAVSAASLGLTISRDPPTLVAAPNVSMPTGLELWLDVGDTGTLDGITYRVLGVVARRREDAQWEEYCLYAAGVGVRWLVVSDGHWSYVAPVDAGAVGAEPIASEHAQVIWASGELPWAAAIGEAVMTSEHADLTLEWTPTEISWSRATDLPPDTVARAFKKRALPRPK